MRSARKMIAFAAMALAVVLAVSMSLFAQSPSKSTDHADTAVESDDEHRVSVEVARQRAKLTHNICSAMLDVIHHRYFRDDRTTVPSVAMEDAFPRIAALENVSARWITVNAKVMNVDHEPRDEFEKQAAKAIAAGKIEHEVVEDGVYRRAEGISLMNKGCLQCHLGFGPSGRIDRFAGLVISIPVTKE